ncbi:MAG TPA: pyridoxamine 5'-phosphate oxidase family protein [Anaerolineales bacterium]|nr:pyridoxamine 5'-phosphate oxidase family protein [Anaerolineales bacterium]
MTILKITRPKFPKGYVDNPTSYVDWDWVAAQLTDSKNYWLCSIRPDGRPHAIPRWAVYLDDRIYYDGSPETRHARNIESNPQISVHLENGSQVVILEGLAVPAGKPAIELANRLAETYRKKYTEFGYSPEPNQWDEDGLYVFTPQQCLAWTVFNENPTKFVFETE